MFVVSFEVLAIRAAGYLRDHERSVTRRKVTVSGPEYG